LKRALCTDAVEGDVGAFDPRDIPSPAGGHASCVALLALHRMLLPFSIDPTASPDSGNPPSDPPPTPRTDEPRMIALTESRPPPSSDADPDQLRAVFAASPLPIVALDPTGRVTLWNPAAEVAFGWTAGEALGRIAPDEFVELCMRALAGETITSLAVAPRDKSGEPLDARVSIAPLKTARGDVYGVVAIYAIASARSSET
jgi:PAS domain S-box-containing protein